MSERRSIVITVLDIGGSYSNDFPMSLTAFRDLIASRLESVPSEFRDAVTVENEDMDGYDGNDYHLIARYQRPETDAEFASRLSQEREQARARAQHQEREEREALARLKAKYEP